MINRKLSAPLAPRSSSWELTSDALFPHHTDDVSSSHIYEVEFEDSYMDVDESIFTSWTGARRLDGSNYHGPIYNMGTSTLYTGPRACSCSICSATTAPEHRSN